MPKTTGMARDPLDKVHHDDRRDRAATCRTALRARYRMSRPLRVDAKRRVFLPRGHDDERGVAMVELVLIVPLFLILLMGLVSSGIVYNHKLDLVHAAREGARYGATVPQNTCLQTPNPCGTKTWAQLVQGVVAQRSDGDVTTAQVCVSLVSGTTGAPISAGFTTKSDGSHCYDDGNGDIGVRVQVRIVRANDSINAAFFKVPVTLTSTATAKFEQ
jgi:Flp pilus assembly protein TadG